jgi:hypothetical protein
VPRSSQLNDYELLKEICASDRLNTNKISFEPKKLVSGSKQNGETHNLKPSRSPLAIKNVNLQGIYHQNFDGEE